MQTNRPATNPCQNILGNFAHAARVLRLRASPPCINLRRRDLAGLVPEKTAEASKNLFNNSRHAWLDIKRATSNSGPLVN